MADGVSLIVGPICDLRSAISARRACFSCSEARLARRCLNPAKAPEMSELSIQNTCAFATRCGVMQINGIFIATCPGVENEMFFRPRRGGALREQRSFRPDLVG